MVRAAFACLLLFAVAGWQPSAHAQEAEPAASDPVVQDEAAAADAADAVEGDVETLIRILENDAARAQLIEQLRAAGTVPAAAETEPPAEPLAARLAEYTRDLAEGAAGIFARITEIAEYLGNVTDGALAIDLDAFWQVAANVGLLVAATFAVFLVLQLVFRRIQRRLAETAAVGDLLSRTKRMGASTLLDAATVAVAWGAGYVFALSIGRAQEIGIDQSLFLNAFLIIELIKTGSRAVLGPRWTALRPIPLDDTSAAYWYFWLSRLVSLVGYTFLFVAPILATGVSSDAAEAVRIIVMFTALVVAVAITLQNREGVRTRLMRRAAAGRTDPLSKTLAAVARTWHIVAIGYLIAVFTLWLADPETALPFVLAATAKSVIAVAIGALLTAFIGRVISGGMRLPADVKARLPLLEARLNAFVPNVLRVVRAIITVAVVVTIVQIWRFADVTAWLASDSGQSVLASAVSVALILLAAGVIYLAMQSWIEYRLNPNLGRIVTARERTLLGLFRNAFTIVLGVLVFMLVLSYVGVNIAPLLAGAGVVGLAIGFGAQKLVQDIINGAFIQFENTMNEGDVVTVGGTSGVVERLTIRSVSLRSLDGTYHVIPFSSVDTVSNFMKHFSYHLAAIGVAYRESIPDVKEAMLEAFERLKQTEHRPDILGDFEMQGVVEFASSSMVVRGRIKTLPGKQWGVGRAYNEFLKTVFDERGIEIPFPHVRLYLGENKDGEAPPLRILNAGSSTRDAAAPSLPPADDELEKRDRPARRKAGARTRKEDAPPHDADDSEIEDPVSQGQD